MFVSKALSIYPAFKDNKDCYKMYSKLNLNDTPCKIYMDTSVKYFSMVDRVRLS